MEFELLGFSRDKPTLDLDHERFAYAGKFVVSRTGKTAVRDGEDLVGAVAFSADHGRTDAIRLRYVTVREDRRGEGIGPRLLRFTAERLQTCTDEVLIAVNNPIAYQACYRAGFVWTGTETGMAELLLRYEPGDTRAVGQYREGFRVFERRDLPPAHQRLLDRHITATPPTVVTDPAVDS